MAVRASQAISAQFLRPDSSAVAFGFGGAVFLAVKI